MSEAISTELWKDIPGFPGYQASTLGRVRSVDRTVIGKEGKLDRRRGKVLRPSLGKHRYLTVSPSYEGRWRTKLVHRLVAIAFLGECPEGMEVNHKSGVRIDCRLDNLEYLTRAANKKHGYDIGISTISRGEATHNHKLTEETVREARLLNGTISHQELADRFGVSRQVMSKAIRGDTWGHVT